MSGAREKSSGATPHRTPRLLAVLMPYVQRRPLAVLALGVASGFPLALVLATLTLWLSELGVSKGAIGLFAAVTIPYSLKFLWAPVIQTVRLPYLGRWLGHRRSWLVLVGSALIYAVWRLGLSDPASHLGVTAFWAVAVATFSASQDIIVDAYRIEALTDEEQAAGATMITVGYRVGLLLTGAGTLLLASAFGWPAAYMISALLVLVGWVAAWVLGEPWHPPAADRGTGRRVADFLREMLVDPLASFFRGQGAVIAVLIVAFLVLHKLGDASAAIMTAPLLVDLGFSKPEIAFANKTVGALAALAGSGLAAAVIYWLGMRWALLATSLFMMVSNLMFTLLAVIGHDVALLALTIGIENFSSALGGTVLVAY
ncbi:MAG: MFS transporter, partial [Alphaproteobacteria bacterium]